MENNKNVENNEPKVMDPAEIQKNKVKEITDKLESGIKELFDSEKYVTWLNTMSKFHEYSLNNTILIAMQKPDATMVAGYTQWQKDFERNVNKGEKAIRILAWNPYKEKVERDKLDPETHEPVRDENGNTVKEVTEVQRPSYKVVNVFDVSQTDGKELPRLGISELEGSVKNFDIFLEALKRTCPVPMAFEDIQGSAKGYFHQKDQRIAIQSGMSEIQTIKTAIHEMAHQKLHSVELEAGQKAKYEEKAQTRSEKEVEAESVAYTVCQHFGIDTSDYSFGYVAGWSAGKEMAELKASLLTIRRAAASMIDDIEGHIKEIDLERIESMTIEEAAERLAVKLDTFAYDTDPYSYNDAIDDREQALEGLKHDLITGDKSLEGVEEFLKGVIEADCLESPEAGVLLGELAAFKERYLEPEKSVEASQEASKATITFYVAECMEFPSYGEYHETDNLKDAFEILDTIPPQRLNAVTGIGFVIHDENSAIDNSQYPLVQGGQIQYEAISMVDYYKDSPLVQGAISECEAILKEREATMDSVKEVAAAKSEKPSKDEQRPTKKSILADLKEKQAIVAAATTAAVAKNAVKAKEAQLC